MANESQHILQAQHNELFLSNIENNPDNLDWMFTVLFYSALHYGDAILAKRNQGYISFKNHEQRRKTYSRKLSRDIFDAYKNLEDNSRTARYYPEWSSVLTERDFKDSYKDDFLKIKKYY